LNPGELIAVQDGTAAVSSQWGIGNINAFLRRAAELNFVIRLAAG
jgi:hypothetical protein